MRDDPMCSGKHPSQDRRAKHTVQALPERLPGLPSELGETRGEEAARPWASHPVLGSPALLPLGIGPQFPTRSGPPLSGSLLTAFRVSAVILSRFLLSMGVGGSR